MRPLISAVVALVLAGSAGAVFAQTASFDDQKVIARMTYHPVVSACPVQFSAQHYGLAATMRQTAQGEMPDYTQSLRLRFTSVDMVQSIEVVVHGREAKSEMLLVSADAPETTAETFRFTRGGNSPDARFDSVQFLDTHSVPLITRLELTRVEYTDGRIWRESAPGRCSIRPSMLVLVNAVAR